MNRRRRQKGITVVHPIDESARASLEPELRQLRDGKLMGDLRDERDLHFLSCTIAPQIGHGDYPADQDLQPDDSGVVSACVVLELNVDVDGGVDEFLKQFAHHRTELINCLFGRCSNFPQGNPSVNRLYKYLLAGVVGNLTYHRGNPGRSLEQIKSERGLHDRVRSAMKAQGLAAASRTELWQKLRKGLTKADDDRVAATPRLPARVRWNLTDPVVRDRAGPLLVLFMKSAFYLLGLALAVMLARESWQVLLVLGIPLAAMLARIVLNMAELPLHLRSAPRRRAIRAIVRRAGIGALVMSAFAGLLVGAIAAGLAGIWTAIACCLALLILLGVSLVLLIIGYVNLGMPGVWIGAAVDLVVIVVLAATYTTVNVLLLLALLYAAVVSAIVVLGLIAVLLKIRFRETDDVVTDVELDRKRYDRVTEREDLGLQNHLASVTVLKPGKLRLLVLRAVLRTINAGSYFVFNRGYLGNIRAIHFARFFILPEQRRLMFLSNYDGTFNGYLGEFKDSSGVTAIWGNTVGFPRPFFLFFGGARDEMQFKRFARDSQVETLLWYSACPDLTVTRIDSASSTRRDLKRPGDDFRKTGMWAELKRLIRPPMTEADLAAALRRIE